MTRFLAGILFVAALCLARPQGVVPIAPKSGAFSAGFSLDWFRGQSGDTISTFKVVPAYFVSDCLELRVPLMLDDLLGNRETAFGFGARLHVGNLGRTKSVSLFDPFLGAEIAHADATGGFREDLVEGQAGFNYFVANNIAVTTTLSLGRDRTNGVSGNETHLTTGLTVFFAGK